MALALGAVWRWNNGRMRKSAAVPAAPGSASRAPRVTVAELGQPLGSRATLLQFSSAFCAPCRATRRILVRLLDVRRTPTVFVLGPDGQIARRASGQPRKADVIAALGTVT